MEAEVDPDGLRDGDQNGPPALAFDLELEHGRCVGVRIPDSDADVDALIASILMPDEQRAAERLGRLRRRTWAGGRAAMRVALRRLGIAAPPAILSDDRGAPILPTGIIGSITHKEWLAAALVALAPPASRARIGVDLEPDLARKEDISSRVLTNDELIELGQLASADRAREVLLRFSAKESIYKALDPFVRRYVGFKEVGVSTLGDGTATVAQHLREGEGPFRIDVRWLRVDAVVLTTARVEAL